VAAAPRFTPRTLYAIAGAFSEGSPVALVARAVASAAQEVARLRAPGPIA
jgi:hypothetical protein